MLCYRQPREITRFDDRLMTVCGALVEVILERRRARHKQGLVIGELQHRTRNLFATIGALVHFSYQSNSDFQGFQATIDGRLRAMANAHGWMLDERGVDMHTLTVEMLKPYSGDRSLQISGPPIALPPGWTMSLSMAMHELATNAAKYGALSVPQGKLNIEWDIVHLPDGEARFSFMWVERDGPPVTAPTRHGFGVRAIERMLAQEIEGKAQLVFSPDGLRCAIEAPFGDRSGTQKRT